jgi:hypothetical protein
MTNIFSWGIGGEAMRENFFRKATENPEALAAYQDALNAYEKGRGVFLPRRRCPVLRRAFQSGLAAGKSNVTIALSFSAIWVEILSRSNPYPKGSALGIVWDRGYRRGERKVQKEIRHARLSAGSPPRQRGRLSAQVMEARATTPRGARAG